MTIRTVLAVAVMAVGATSLVAQNDPVSVRKALMKRNGEQARIASAVVKGERPFNLDEARKVFATFSEVAEKARPLFPEDSRTGDTAALPAIWENKSDFEAKLQKLHTEAKAALDATTDLNSFKEQVSIVTKNCGGCHQTYRKRQT